MSPKVSVIVTVYNKPQYLRECLDSVVNQTYQNWELIVMEDNSPNPEVKEILDTYTDPRIKKFFSNVSEKDRYQTARYATLINLAVKHFVTGDYITYLTDDDYYYPHRLETMVNGMNPPEISVVYGAQRVVDADGNPGGIRGPFGILTGRGNDDEAFNKVDHNSVMHTKQAFIDANGWYDVKGVWGGADAYFWRRLHQAGYTFYPVSDVDNPLEAKRYHTDSVQWLIVNGKFGWQP